MNILIAGKSGTGKSNLGDIIRNGIFKADKNSVIKTNDMDREVKTFGNGKNVYNLRIRKLVEGEDILLDKEVTFGSSGAMEHSMEDFDKYDIVVILKGGEFKKRYDSLRS